MSRDNDPAVAKVINAQSVAVRCRLLELRDLILETAAETDGVGEMIETLKWGEPAYLPKKPRTGTTVRIAPRCGSADEINLLFHCQTTLIDGFRQRYPKLRYDGNRAIVLPVSGKLPAPTLRHCIAQALTYHLKAKRAA
ncbi:MAG: DUF1801 domain-containing protein [Alphaproteobacteria bacterium]